MKKGIIAAGHQITADAAAELIRDGGNAFDAALAGLFAACTTEIVLASLGGGGFLMAHHAASGKTVLYDFFVDTPRCQRPMMDVDFRSVDVDFGPATQEFHVGLGATATPGFVPGVFAVHSDLCRLSMSRIVEPAVKVSREGIVMTPFQAYLFSIASPILVMEAAGKALHAPHGKLLHAGDTYRNPALAETIEQLALDGPELFVHGDIGQAIVRQAAAAGGHLSVDDLINYRVEKREPLRWTHSGRDLFLNPSPAASGPLIAFSLSLLESLSADTVSPLVNLARIMAVTNDARQNYSGHLEVLADREIIAAHLNRLEGHSKAYRGTTHISVIDAEGNAAAATVSNGEGNGHMVGPYGFMLNNMLGEEDLNPQGFNSWPPGQRLSSMMAPTIISDTNGMLSAMGSGGSNRIRTAILQVVCNLIDRGMTLDSAVNAPRVHVERDGAVSFEDLFDPKTATELRTAFPDANAWPERNMFFGGVHSVIRQADGSLEGVGDVRRAGVCLAVE